LITYCGFRPTLINGNILRAQTTAAAAAVNAQLRADETKMKQVQKGDMLAKLLEIMEVERVKLMEFDRAQLEKELHKTLPDKNTPS
jgi:DNA topoisomerase VI subunit B